MSLAFLPLLLSAGLGDLLEEVADADADDAAPVVDGEVDAKAGDDDDVTFVAASVRANFDGRFGVSVGNVLLVPFAIPGPAAGGELSAQLVFVEHITVGGDLALSFGLSTDRADPAPLAGYKGRLRFGLLADADHLVLAADFHVGVSSIALLPLPRVGLGGSATFRLYRDEFFVWDIKADADLDLVIIAPSPGLGLSSGFTARYGYGEAGVRLGVDADAVIAVLVNTAGAAAYVNVFVGGRF